MAKFYKLANALTSEIENTLNDKQHRSTAKSLKLVDEKNKIGMSWCQEQKFKCLIFI